jgi:hypothetical protein
MSSKKHTDQAPAPNYKGELNKRKTQLHKQIKELNKIVYAPNVKMNDEWFKKHNRLNLLNIDLITVKSRLNNLGNYTGGLEVVKVDINQISNK